MFGFNMQSLYEQPQQPVYITIKYLTSVGEHLLSYTKTYIITLFFIDSRYQSLNVTQTWEATFYTDGAGSVLTPGQKYNSSKVPWNSIICQDKIAL